MTYDARTLFIPGVSERIREFINEEVSESVCVSSE